MDYEYFVDADKLSVHTDNIIDEKRTAQGLQENLNQIKRQAYATVQVDSDLLHKFQRVSEDIDDLVMFYTKLFEATDETAYDVVETVRKIDQILTDNKLSVENTVNRTFNG